MPESIDFSSVLTFLLGLLSGAILMVLIYLLMVVLTLKKRTYIVETAVENISEEEVKQMIKRTQDKFLLERNDDNEEVKAKALQNGVYFLIQDIASRFYPKSNRPLAELTIDELILLDKYIVKRIEEIVDRPGIRMIKRMRLNTVIKIAQTKKKVDGNAIVKATKKYKFDKMWNFARAALNVINPVYWIKKLVINPSMGLIMKKISLLIISIAGEETFRIYSKQAFSEQDEEFAKLVDEIANSGKELEETLKKDPN